MGDRAKKWKIGTFARIRPPRRGAAKSYSPLHQAADGTVTSITFPYPASPDTRSNLKQRDELEFHYTKVFDPTTSQDTIFNDMCLDIVRGAIDGYNGTVLAYGQTGSGKTFTITGGESYSDRGIIPRAISTLFEEFESRVDTVGSVTMRCPTRPRMRQTFRCYISYLEIYNENIYDLLDRAHMEKPIDEWTKIQIQLSDESDDNDDVHFRSLGVYEANSEEEALNLLFLGNANRVTSDTPMNQASSRSHSIFTLLIESRRVDSEVVLHSKLHVVDLAGSERVFKRDGSERMRTEGRFINLSLHHLEQVILALQAKPATMGGNRRSTNAKVFAKPPHVPYRNSTLTSVLRGSLGGNAKSVFIGTINPEAEFVDESISTCRFMQRCSEVDVDARVNEEVDVHALVQLLKKENEQLKLDHAHLASTLEAQLECHATLQAKLDAVGTVGADVADTAVCDALVERFLVTEWGSLAHTDALGAIQHLGMASVLYCLQSTKESLIFASNTTADVQEQMQSQSARMEELEARLMEQKSDAEKLKRVIAALTEQLKTTEIAGGMNSSSSPLPVTSSIPPAPSAQTHHGSHIQTTPTDKVVVDTSGVMPPTLKRTSNMTRLSATTTTQRQSTGASDAIKRRMELLKQGSIFIKHGRKGNPHPRFVWCSTDLQYLCYRAVGGGSSPTAPIEIPTSSIQSLVLGQTTKVFQRKGDPARAAYSFSLVYDDGKRTLDLEVDEGESAGRNRQKCTDWTDALLYLIKLKAAQAPPKAKD
ncbi:Aste57867_18152 [Aphanomyces stellatus]|uniref:Kinesin-like protein n=1 Tax=Aphanomyces stellatus TaxID=120398 RepID=A0A485LA77_9STRA|nr:hypothetical protein As57867_018090 [Aphanomyces stellatus]VFT94890.1 Aste57867_18152 [Aphanomyces stellatus]